MRIATGLFGIWITLIFVNANCDRTFRNMDNFDFILFLRIFIFAFVFGFISTRFPFLSHLPCLLPRHHVLT